MSRLSRKLRRMCNSLRSITNHPLTQNHKYAAIKRYFLFHLIGYLAPGPIIYPFIKNVKFIASPGMAGIVANIYCGLHDFEEMGFLLHFLRPKDLFIDIGANVGSYTILAAGVCGANSIAFEPIPQTFQNLMINIGINHLNRIVTAHNCGVGADSGELYFTKHLDAMNKIILNSSNTTNLILVKILPLDLAIQINMPTLLKIDVEGYEHEVLCGATETLNNPNLKAIIIELAGHNGTNDQKAHELLLRNSFAPFEYDPFARKLMELEGYNKNNFNTIYIRDYNFVVERIRNAEHCEVLGKII